MSTENESSTCRPPSNLNCHFCSWQSSCKLVQLLLDTTEVSTKLNAAIQSLKFYRCKLFLTFSWRGMHTLMRLMLTERYQMNRKTAFQIKLSHWLPEALLNISNIDFTFRNAIQKWPRQVLLSFLTIAHPVLHVTGFIFCSTN